MRIADLPVLDPIRPYSTAALALVEKIEVSDYEQKLAMRAQIVDDFLQAHGWAIVRPPVDVEWNTHRPGSWPNIRSSLDDHTIIAVGSAAQITIYQPYDTRREGYDIPYEIAEHAARGMKLWSVNHPGWHAPGYTKLVLAVTVLPWAAGRHSEFATQPIRLPDNGDDGSFHEHRNLWSLPLTTVVYRRVVRVKTKRRLPRGVSFFRMEFATEKDAILWNLHHGEDDRLRARRQQGTGV